MAGMNNRNPPFSPFSVNSVTEIRRPPHTGGLGSVIPRPEIPRPPYIGGRVRGNIPGMVAMIALFRLEQLTQARCWPDSTKGKQK